VGQFIEVPPYQNSATTHLIADRIRDLSHRKTQAEIASEAGFANANMMTFLKTGKNKVPLDRVPSLAKALEVDPAYLMRLALDQAVGATAAKAITDIFGTPATENERGWQPMPSFPDLAALNDWLEQRCVAQWHEIAHAALPPSR
jgi:transcriptional regulator with XRE-family HTH domain